MDSIETVTPPGCNRLLVQASSVGVITNAKLCSVSDRGIVSIARQNGRSAR